MTEWSSNMNSAYRIFTEFNVSRKMIIQEFYDKSLIVDDFYFASKSIKGRSLAIYFLFVNWKQQLGNKIRRTNSKHDNFQWFMWLEPRFLDGIYWKEDEWNTVPGSHSVSERAD